MVARVTLAEVDAVRMSIDSALEIYRTSVMPALRTQDGFGDVRRADDDGVGQGGLGSDVLADGGHALDLLQPLHTLAQPRELAQHQPGPARTAAQTRRRSGHNGERARGGDRRELCTRQGRTAHFAHRSETYGDHRGSRVMPFFTRATGRNPPGSAITRRKNAMRCGLRPPIRKWIRPGHRRAV